MKIFFGVIVLLCVLNQSVLGEPIYATEEILQCFELFKLRGILDHIFGCPETTEECKIPANAQEMGVISQCVKLANSAKNRVLFTIDQESPLSTVGAADLSSTVMPTSTFS